MSTRHHLLRACPALVLVLVLALALVSATGCAGPLAPAASGAAPLARTPASKPDAAPAPDPTTLSYAEAAVILRRTALMRAFGLAEPSVATLELRVIWDDAIGRPEEDALLELLDAYLLRTSERDRAVDSELRIAVAQAWFDRGKVDRIRPHAAKVRGDLEEIGSGAWVEMLARLDGRDAAASYAADEPERKAALALFDARAGDAARAEQAIADTLDASYACPVVVALAERYAREGRTDAARWSSAADAAPGEVDPEALNAFEACVVALAQARLRQGDRAGAAAAFARVGGHDILSTCVVLQRVIDRVDPTLLDGLLLEGARSERADPTVTWYGCPGVLGELAARRGERGLAAHLLTRAIRDVDDGGEGDRYDYTWTTSVRLGRTDPFGADGFHRDVFRTLALARILDEAPTLRLSRQRLDEALAPEVEEEEAGEDGEAP